MPDNMPEFLPVVEGENDNESEISQPNETSLNPDNNTADHNENEEPENLLDPNETVQEPTLGINSEESQNLWKGVGEMGIMVSGLWLFGASWDSSR